jgi:hypothetical protein
MSALPLKAHICSARRKYVHATSNPVCCKPFVMERSESNFLFPAYIFANASAASEAIIGRRLGNLAMGSV